MTTTPIVSWKVPLTEIGPIYPFAGHEIVFVILASIAWIGFHIWQMRHEDNALRQEAREIAERLKAGTNSEGTV